MRIAITSAGPSLAYTWRNEFRFDYVIGVNRSILHAPCDWLAVGDACTLVQIHEVSPVLPRVGCITMRDTVASPPPTWSKTPMVAFEEFPGWRELQPAGNYSIQAALAAAAVFAHGQSLTVEVYGHDMAGAADISGCAGEQRNEERWTKERACWAASLTWAARQGITVNHIPG